VYRPPVLERDCELPVPGYAGFVPRVGVTEVGLGTRYTPQTKNGLDWFYAEQARRGDLLCTNPGGTSRSRDDAMDSQRLAALSTFTLEQSSLQSSNRNKAELSATRPAVSSPTTTYVCEHSSHNPGGLAETKRPSGLADTTRPNGLAETTRPTKTAKAVSFVV